MKKILILLSISSIISTVYAANNTNTKKNSTCSMPVVKLTTNYGDIDIQLNKAKAPITVANFEQYVTSGFYVNKIFHRVIPGFMIQGGGFTVKMDQSPTKQSIQNEAFNGLKNDKYTISMARTSDPQSATAQFFINVNNNDSLNFTSQTPAGYGYAVFGKVIKGTDVVDKIAGVTTTSNMTYQDVPVKPVIIKATTILPCNK